MAETNPPELPLRSIYHVVPLQGGRWELLQEGGTTIVYDDKQTAVTAALELARGARPGAVKVHGLNGTIESEQIVT